LDKRFSYDLLSNKLNYHTPSGAVSIDGVLFPYGQDEVDNAVTSQINCKNKKVGGRPLSWEIEDHGDYYIFKVSFEEIKPPYINFSKSDGVIGIDCNFDHFAVSETNSIGQLVHSFVQKFTIEGKSSGQINKIIENEAVSLVDYAVRINKPIVIEKLDTTISKVSNHYGSKKANRRMSLFAYNKMISAIKSRAAKMGVAVFEVNPAYTSQIGKMKYMKRLGLSIHQAAAYVIARRSQGFKEKLPPVLLTLSPEKMIGQHHWVHWKHWTNNLKDVRTHAFYFSELFDVAKFVSTKQLFHEGALLPFEEMGLAKIIK